MNIPLKREPSNLECLIQDLEILMERHDPVSEEYQTMLKTYERLVDVRDKNKRKPISLDTALVVAANLVSIVAIIKAEQFHGLTSKVWGMLLRTRSS